MSMKAIIGIIVAVIVLGGGGWYLYSQQGMGSNTTNEGEQGEIGTGTYQNIFALAGSQECQITVTTPQSPATGTVYVSAGEVRSDVVATPDAANGEQVNAHMIRSGGYIYLWSDALAQGMKVKETSANSNTSGAPYDANAEVKYSCKPWIPDSSKFELPSGVTFMEFNVGAGANIPDLPMAAPSVN